MIIVPLKTPHTATPAREALQVVDVRTKPEAAGGEDSSRFSNVTCTRDAASDFPLCS